MSNAVTISRRFSGFKNVADTWIIGEDDGHAGTVKNYLLPEGYSIGRRPFEDTEQSIYDSAGFECAINTHGSGRPQLTSKSGPISNQPVLTIVE